MKPPYKEVILFAGFHDLGVLKVAIFVIMDPPLPVIHGLKNSMRET